MRFHSSSVLSVITVWSRGHGGPWPACVVFSCASGTNSRHLHADPQGQWWGLGIEFPLLISIRGEAYNPDFISITSYCRSEFFRITGYLDYHINMETHPRKMHIFKKSYQLPEALEINDYKSCSLPRWAQDPNASLLTGWQRIESESLSGKSL